MIIGGFDNDGSPTLSSTAEVYNLETGEGCIVSNYPFEVNFATGAFVNGSPVVCGGYWSTSECYSYNTDFDRWDRFPGMTIGRHSHMSSILPDGKWMITGGKADLRSGKSSDIFDGEEFSTGPVLPDPFYGHCQVN